MKFPDSKLYGDLPTPTLDFSHLKIDPDKPHQYMPQLFGTGYGGCRACHGSPKLPVHIEPIGGWPQ